MTDPYQKLLDLSATPLVPHLSTARILRGHPRVRAVATGEGADGTELEGRRVAILATDGVEEIELTLVRKFFRDRGARVDLVAPDANYIAEDGNLTPPQRETHILTIRFIDHGGWLPIDVHLRDADPEVYDAVVVPGGTWNPDTLRADEAVLAFLNAAHSHDKVVAAICHGPWVLVSAGLLEGRDATAWSSIRVDLENAGATFHDEPVVVSGRIVTARTPLDIPQFCDAITELLG